MAQRLLRNSVLFVLACIWAQGFALATSKKPPVHPININAANSEELQQVPGIGPATADKILQMRKSYGAFKSVDDLLATRGIGPKRLGKMRKYLVAGRSPQPAKAPSANAKPANCAGWVPRVRRLRENRRRRNQIQRQGLRQRQNPRRRRFQRRLRPSRATKSPSRNRIRASRRKSPLGRLPYSLVSRLEARRFGASVSPALRRATAPDRRFECHSLRGRRPF